MQKTIKYPGSNPLSQIINKLREDLLDAGYAYGAMFLCDVRSRDVGIFFPEGMPQHARMAMLDDMQEALNVARKAFTV